MPFEVFENLGAAYELHQSPGRAGELGCVCRKFADHVSLEPG